MARKKRSKADNPNKIQPKKRAPRSTSLAIYKAPKALKKDNRKTKANRDESWIQSKAAKSLQSTSNAEKKLYNLIVDSTFLADSMTVSQTSRRVVVYITAKEQESKKAYVYIKNIYESIFLLAQKNVQSRSTIGQLKKNLDVHNIFVMTLSTFNLVLKHDLLTLEMFSAIFAMQAVLHPLKQALQRFKPPQHSLPGIYITSNMFLLLARHSMVSLELGFDIKNPIKSSSASLDILKDNPVILKIQKNGLELQNELGLWASELYFSHALNRLAELMDNNNFLSLVGGSLSHSLLEPCLLAANAVSKLHPGRSELSTSQKVRALLNLLACQSSMRRLRGVILTSCPLMAIYLKKVLGCFYTKHNTAAEAAVPRPEGYIGPLPSIEDVLSSYSNGDVQVLITTFDFFPRLKDKGATWVVLFNASLSVWSYLNLNLTLSSVETYYVFKDDEGRNEIIEFDRDHGDTISYLRLY
ncbi:hypothetical protein DSO57_1004689 [Entomophthora muscae]|uniref:Uncharacterized protein n=1 Tax=Entomophthora muscae TaxID=34485 RepID=A0ACC2U6A0_9FUNG|nr:hypothetical protein DSO57_1004689 [Entomophthora muscae]